MFHVPHKNRLYGKAINISIPISVMSVFKGFMIGFMCKPPVLSLRHVPIQILKSVLDLFVSYLIVMGSDV